METLDKLFAIARDDIGAYNYGRTLERRLNAMNSIGAIEGYLKALREFEKIDHDTYANKFEEMSGLYSKIKV